MHLLVVAMIGLGAIAFAAILYRLHVLQMRHRRIRLSVREEFLRQALFGDRATRRRLAREGLVLHGYRVPAARVPIYKKPGRRA